MATPAKQAAIAEISQRFRESGAAVLTEYRGLSVKQLGALRDALRAHGTYQVVKNTLTDRAAREAGVTAFDGQFSGPSAIAFITGDPVEAAKSLRDFARANPLLVIKAGMLDGRPLSAADIGKLADLESREVLLAKLAGAMNASLAGAVSLFAAPLSQTARVIEAWRSKLEQDGGAPAGAAAPAEATDSTAAEDAAAEPAGPESTGPAPESTGPAPADQTGQSDQPTAAAQPADSEPATAVAPDAAVSGDDS